MRAHIMTILAVLGTAACSGDDRPETAAVRQQTANDSAPRLIRGGRYEASGVVGVPGTSRVLFVDDGRERELLFLELDTLGRQVGAAQRIRLPAHVTDMEGITTDGRHVYVVGSQSKRTGFDGDGLVRFAVDTSSLAVRAVERVRDLKAWLARSVPELRGTERRLGDQVLNIEALAWDPHGRRLLLGLRAPVIDGHALVIPVSLRDSSGGLTTTNLVAGPAIRLPLGGSGLRALEHDAETDRYLLVTGAWRNEEREAFRVFEWDGEDPNGLREIGRYPRELKPEGIARVRIGGRSMRVLVFDTGYYAVLP